MRVIWKGLIAGASAITAAALSQTNSRSGPIFTKDGDLFMPTGFREWVFMGAHYAYNLNGGEAPFPEFHDVYIERKNRLYDQHHGYFPDGLYLSRSLSLPKGSIPGWLTRLGLWPRICSERTSWYCSDGEDSRRLASTNKWGLSPLDIRRHPIARVPE